MEFSLFFTSMPLIKKCHVCGAAVHVKKRVCVCGELLDTTSKSKKRALVAKDGCVRNNRQAKTYQNKKRALEVECDSVCTKELARTRMARMCLCA